MNASSVYLRCICLTLLSFLPAAIAEAEWTQWRGPTRDSQLTAPPWPDSLGPETLKRVWRLELAPSYSGPVTDAARVYSTETRDQRLEAAIAADRATGRIVWRTEWEGALKVPFFAKANGDWIRSTPALDGGRLYVAGMRDVLVCLDTDDGRELWRRDFVHDYGTPLPDFGFVSSPLVDGDSVYVQAGAAVVRLDKLTGKTIWKSLSDKGGMWGGVFSSPVIASLGGKRQLVAQTREQLAGLELADGRVLWTQPTEAFRGMNILTPLIQNDRIYTSTYGGKTTLYEVALTNGTFVPAAVWTHKAQGYMSSPVLIDGIVYQHLKSQRLWAIDLTSGTERWTSSESYGKYVSMIANNRRVLALDQRGRLMLFEARSDGLKTLDTREISSEETWAHLAVAGADIFVRELKALSAYRWESKSNLESRK